MATGSGTFRWLYVVDLGTLEMEGTKRFLRQIPQRLIICVHMGGGSSSGTRTLDSSFLFFQFYFMVHMLLCDGGAPMQASVLIPSGVQLMPGWRTTLLHERPWCTRISPLRLP